MKQSEHIAVFVQCIWGWYARHKRDLPWRDLAIEDDMERAYHILVSEVMLQQTQVSRVKIVFKEFLERFPSIADLAAASNTDVIMAWRGMGYNNRALRLRDATREVIKQRYFPVEMSELIRLPGVGHYTAAAIRNFAFNIPTPCLDTNIRRIIHRSFVGPENADGTWKRDDRYLLVLTEKLLQDAINPSLSSFHFPLSASNWHAALMDYGSLVCTMRNPKWDICPLTKAGVMKAAHKEIKRNVERGKREPGRVVAGKHIPNRIFRGKIVEELRDAKKGLSVEEIGALVCIDWDATQHQEWLEKLIEALKRDQLIRIHRDKVLLA
ncbi:hypothetical protein H6770_05515 [Candidatus Peribacteria bacterium]|nr:hypothetical protein [Candidatus Peribacteria bacterium]